MNTSLEEASADPGLDRLGRSRTLDGIASARTAVAPSLDGLTRLAAEVLEAPMSVVGLLDSELTHVWSAYGCEAGPPRPRAATFCGYAVLQQEMFVVRDTLADARFHEHPNVVGAPHVRSYAGAPLVIDGHIVGSLCVLDTRARDFGLDGLRRLGTIAEQVVAQLELACAKQRLQSLQAEREREVLDMRRFAYSVSHDLKSPALRVKRFAQAASEDCRSGACSEASYCLGQIAQIGEGMGTLINDIVALTQTSRSDARCVTTDLEELLTAVANHHTRFAAEAGVELRVSTEVDTLRVEPARLREILGHLISNGVKYRTPGRGDAFVRLSVTAEADEVHMAVEDNGLGIDAVHQQRVFDMFEQVHPDHAAGMGLGMTIVRRHVEALGGCVELQSTPGVGTRFIVRLPRRERSK
ncbi:MAG: GAF domain-containing sensor histidine kinase [Deltaproteobacteria bacterium]